jgi:hypothetical protein
LLPQPTKLANLESIDGKLLLLSPSETVFVDLTSKAHNPFWDCSALLNGFLSRDWDLLLAQMKVH